MKKLLLLTFFISIASLANATNPISIEAYDLQISSEESKSNLAKWWKTAKVNINSISKWTLITGLSAGPTLIIGILADLAVIGYLGIGLMILSLILGCIVLFHKNKSSESYKRTRFRAILGMLFALLPIAIGILFVLTFSL